MERNQQLKRYLEKGFDNLCSRYEEPDGRNRWDAPLFTIINEDEPLTEHTKIVKDVLDAIVHKKPPAPNLSTVVKPIHETNYLHELDTTTNDVIERLLDAQKNGQVGDIKVPRSKVAVCKPNRLVPVVELRKLKRQFMNINKFHTMTDMDMVATSFAEYLNTNL
jgi:protein KTI12